MLPRAANMSRSENCRISLDNSVSKKCRLTVLCKKLFFRFKLLSQAKISQKIKVLFGLFRLRRGLFFVCNFIIFCSFFPVLSGVHRIFRRHIPGCAYRCLRALTFLLPKSNRLDFFQFQRSICPVSSLPPR